MHENPNPSREIPNYGIAWVLHVIVAIVGNRLNSAIARHWMVSQRMQIGGIALALCWNVKSVGWKRRKHMNMLLLQGLRTHLTGFIAWAMCLCKSVYMKLHATHFWQRDNKPN